MSTLRRDSGITVEGLPRPIAARTDRIVLVGMGVWVLALVVVLLVPALHDGDRSWWPWACVSGLALGAVGYAYVRRGRGNAADALPADGTAHPQAHY